MARAAPLTYVSDWLPPDFGAVGQYSLLFAQEYAAREGRAVTLIGLTSGRSSMVDEPLGGGRLKTVRLASSPVPRARLCRRLLWTLWTNLRLARAVIVRTPRGGEVLFTGSPPFMIFFLTPLRWLFGYRLTYRITDFHPECLMASMAHVPWSMRLFYRATLFLRRRVDAFQVLGEDQRRELEAIGIRGPHVVIKRDPSPVSITQETRPLPVPEAANDRVLLLYSGNLGVAHEIATFVEGYIDHHKTGSGRVLLWLNAVGTGVDQMVARLARARCPLVLGRPVPLEQLASLLVTPHAHLITLRDQFVGFVLPSKVYGCVKSGRDILFVGSRRSDVDLVARGGVRSDQRYYQADVGDVAAVTAALEDLVLRHAGPGASGTLVNAPERAGTSRLALEKAIVGR